MNPAPPKITAERNDSSFFISTSPMAPRSRGNLDSGRLPVTQPAHEHSTAQAPGLGCLLPAEIPATRLIPPCLSANWFAENIPAIVWQPQCPKSNDAHRRPDTSQ